MAAIIIIEDSAYTRAKMRAVLEAEGHEIVEASNGTRGLQIVFAGNPDCVILDLIMPEIDGIKLLKAIRDKDSKIPVLVVTADIQESVRQQCMDMGATAFLSKPVKEEELRSTVRKIIQGRSR
jgi:CheY-like chemotaxis protein